MSVQSATSVDNLEMARAITSREPADSNLFFIQPGIEDGHPTLSLRDRSVYSLRMRMFRHRHRAPDG